MVSAPPRVRWDYDVNPEPGSEEHRLVQPQAEGLAAVDCSKDNDYETHPWNARRYLFFFTL